MCGAKRFSFWPCFLEYVQLPVLTKKLKYFTKSPGGQSDDIRQQQSDSGVCVFSLLVSHSYVYVICWRQDPLEFPSIQNKLLCSTGVMTKHCCYSTCCHMILKFSITAAAITCVCVCVCVYTFFLSSDYLPTVGKNACFVPSRWDIFWVGREPGYCEMFEEEANTRPWLSWLEGSWHQRV